MSAKKVIIIGGGIAGLTAGIYAQKAGFESEVFEKNITPGGQCTGWNRQGFHIDNCISWMTCASEKYQAYEMWKEIGIIGDGVKVKQHDAFYTSELNGQTVSLWRDLARSEKEMLLLSPEDSKEIKKFFKYVRKGECLEVPCSKPMDLMNPLEITKLGLSMSGMAGVMMNYSKINLFELSARFKHPLLKKMILDYLPGSYQAYILLTAYSTIASGGGGVPYGGSQAAALRIVKKYTDKGGILHTRSNVKAVKIVNNKATGIILDDGKEINADYVICATDPDHTFHSLLDENLMPESLVRAYKNSADNPLGSSFQVALSFDGITQTINHRFFFDCEGFNLANKKITRMNVKNYSFDPVASPKEKNLIQVKILQDEKDFLYWEALYKTDKDKYNEAKQKAAKDIVSAIEKRFPSLNGKFKIIDVWTPYTYARYCNAYRGVYMSFITTPKSKDIFQIPGVVPNVENVFLAGQWLAVPGGIPIAMTTGKFAIQRILKAEGKSIKLNP